MDDDKRLPKKSYLQTFLRVMLCIAALVGIWCSIGASRQVATLQVELERFTKAVGYMPIKDPTKVYVLALPGESEHVWRFRVYLPPNYDAHEAYRYGQISGSTSRHRSASGGASSTGVVPEPVEYFVTIAFLKEKDHWELHTSTRNSRGCGGLGQEFEKLIETPNALDIEVAGADGPEQFDTDEPICLIRMRDRQPVKNQGADKDKDKDDPFYNGFFYFIVPRPALPSFEAGELVWKKS